MRVREATRLRLGRIGYLNTLPFYHHLDFALQGETLELDWKVGSPAEMNQKLREGEIDVAPISSLEYLNHRDQYALLPGLCIGARDFSASVLLFSREKIEGLNGAPVALSEESLSAATLLKILLKFKFGFKNEFCVVPQDPEAMLRRSKACLVIGDRALFYRPEEFLYKSDLSEIWWDWTSQPFCFSLWAVRKEFYEQHPEEVKVFCGRLKANLQKNLVDLEKLIREGFGITLADERFSTAFGYLFNINYGFDEGMREGLELFYEYAHRLGVSPSPKKLEWISV